ncbi:hypothetical protein [uncultured Massilia sp.]|uniref:hypothetical protein n=1 Tax=uncultured Massilia sp. TaxID=169973 RepID=UPI0025D1F66A|nr:hypothetical protein [uncultured Massilia sp.]
MTWLSHFVRYLGVLNDPRLEPETIDGLPPFALRQAVESLLRQGWIKTYEYTNADAWIDYARVDLRRGRSKLKLEWDQESGGSVAGPHSVLTQLRVLDPWTQMQVRHGVN